MLASKVLVVVLQDTQKEKAFLDGDSWADIAADWSDDPERVQNCARQWAFRYEFKWPARKEDQWEKNVRSRKGKI